MLVLAAAIIAASWSLARSLTRPDPRRIRPLSFEKQEAMMTLDEQISELQADLRGTTRRGSGGRS